MPRRNRNKNKLTVNTIVDIDDDDDRSYCEIFNYWTVPYYLSTGQSKLRSNNTGKRTPTAAQDKA
jgi:hypothetical protein